ncbi:DsbA family protein [Novosphingobium flavum]|uniref:DsbA family protein n=1 Tax=Novosphingobium flavum TaxID=1778672 RepID=A0A7X1FQC8_9SPHN|nr:DsbA family protein [Novosphingobium flavum]MBC2664607.1 DsbA family protein [Novosphingobium flavum]
MSDTNPSQRRRARLINAALALGCALLGAAAGWYWQAGSIGADGKGALPERDRVAVEQVVHDYLMAHPEILPEAMAEYDRKKNLGELNAVRGAVEQASLGTVLGNPRGKLTLVEFTDYACGYCRHSVSDVDALIAANPDLRVVVRELPILTPASADAAKMAIAAAEQGRYPQFHQAMFASGRPDAGTIAEAARAAGIDMARAQRVIADPKTEAELVRNLDLARQLGFSGTPSWVIGDAMMTGAVGADRLAKAVADARS